MKFILNTIITSKQMKIKQFKTYTNLIYVLETHKTGKAKIK